MPSRKIEAAPKEWTQLQATCKQFVQQYLAEHEAEFKPGERQIARSQLNTMLETTFTKAKGYIRLALVSDQGEAPEDAALKKRVQELSVEAQERTDRLQQLRKAFADLQPSDDEDMEEFKRPADYPFQANLDALGSLKPGRQRARLTEEFDKIKEWVPLQETIEDTIAVVESMRRDPTAFKSIPPIHHEPENPFAFLSKAPVNTFLQSASWLPPTPSSENDFHLLLNGLSSSSSSSSASTSSSSSSSSLSSGFWSAVSSSPSSSSASSAVNTSSSSSSSLSSSNLSLPTHAPVTAPSLSSRSSCVSMSSDHTPFPSQPSSLSSKLNSTSLLSSSSSFSTSSFLSSSVSSSSSSSSFSSSSSSSFPSHSSSSSLHVSSLSNSFSDREPQPLSTHISSSSNSRSETKSFSPPPPTRTPHVSSLASRINKNPSLASLVNFDSPSPAPKHKRKMEENEVEI